MRGEISNFTHHSSGHMYFTLKDADGRLKSIMFASHNQKLGFIPKEGTKVIARGNISVYERDGAYQFYVTAMQPDGIGSLYLAFEQLKKKLEGEGLFAPERKKPIPRFPRAIGVITSPTGAAIRDVIITLQRRFPSIPILLYPVLVQGTQAAPSIVKAIEAMNRLGEADVLIVGRGGGSLEELWAFNEETVARSYRRLRDSDHLGRRPRDGLHDRRLRRRSESADAYGGGRARGAAPPRAEAAAIAAGAAPA